MRAAVGDRIVVAATHLDEPARDGEVLEVHGQGGAPPYLVRWSDTGHVTLFFPGPDAHVEPAPSPPEVRSSPQQGAES
jgi:Domain of unknown function (DUF1918)